MPNDTQTERTRQFPKDASKRFKSPSAPVTKTLYFTSTDSAHFQKWRQFMINETFRIYGKLSCIFNTDEYPEPIPLPEAPIEPFNDANDPGGIQREYIKQLVADKIQDDRQLRKDKPKLFGFILEHLSPASLTQVQRRVVENQLEDNAEDPDPDPDLDSRAIWKTFLADADPLYLWQVIKATHVSSRTLSSRIDRHKAMQAYATIKMGNYEKIDNYKFRFDSVLDTLTACNIQTPSVDDIVTKFIESLNTDYDELKLQIRNDEYAGKNNAWPSSLDAAYVRATRFLTSTTLTTKTDDNVERTVAFMGTASDLTQRRKALHHNKKGNDKQNDKQNGKHAQITPHPLTNSSHTAQPPTPSADTTSTSNLPVPKQPKKPCALCGEMHWISSCPHLEMCQTIIGGSAQQTFTGMTVINHDAPTIPSLPNSLTRTALLAMLTPNDVIIDNASEPNIFKSKHLLSNITSRSPIAVGGINSKGEQLITTLQGEFGPWKDVLYSSTSAANILSYAYTVDNFTVILENKGNTFCVSTPVGSFRFERKGSFFVCDATQLLTMFSQRQLDAIETVRSIQSKLGYPGGTELYNTIKNGGINNIPITSTDVLRFIKTPPTANIIKGKMTSPSPTPRIVDNIHPKDNIHSGTLSVDLIKVEHDVFLVGIIDQISFTLASVLPSKRIPIIRATIQLFLAKARSHNWILSCVSDNEPSIKSLLDQFELRGDTVTSSRHVPIIERRIRVIKERFRTILHGLPFILPNGLVKYLVYFVVSRLNLTMTTSSINEFGNRPAFEIFFNRKIDFKRDLKVSFGDYAQIYDSTNNRINSMRPRSLGAIALLPTGNLSGSIKFLCLSTNKIVTRDKFTPLPIPQEVINHLNRLSPSTDITESTIPSNEESMTVDAADPTTNSPSLDNSIPQEHVSRHPETHEDSLTDNHPSNLTEHTDNANPLIENQTPTYTDPMEPNAPAPTHKYNLRTRKQYKPDDIYTFHITVKEGFRRFKNLAIQAIIAELTNALNYNIWTPIKLRNIPKDTQIIPSFCFLKEKFLATGEFDKLKARLTSCGDRQNRLLYNTSDTSSPTTDITTVFLLSTLALHDNMKVLTADVEAAYLNAPLKRQIVMKLDPIIAAILCKLHPGYTPYLHTDQSLYVHLQKAIYGCIESALLWYEHVSATLLSIPNMKKSKYDPCLFYSNNNIEKIFICVYVDDIQIISNSDNLINTVKEKLNSTYTMKFNEGKTHSYLGLCFKYESDKVIVTAPNYIDSILSDFPIHHDNFAPTPASDDLFRIDETAPILDEQNHSLFHSAVASLLYLSKRIRPDILLATAFLTTRVHTSTTQDMSKLSRVLQYLNSTKDLPLIFHKQHNMTLNIFIDASYGQHIDRKSHTGSIVQLNQSSILSKSTKQRINTKSSSEAELVAISDSIGDLLHIQNMLHELGYPIASAIHQDNQSTIQLINRGRPTQMTRHIDIRYFFVHDIIKRKTIHLQYTATENMVSDILNKPLQGMQFTYLRDILLGIQHPIEGRVVNNAATANSSSSDFSNGHTYMRSTLPTSM